MRRRIAGLLTLALLAALALPAAAAGEQPSAWAQEAVSFAVANGILTEGDVRPREPATRAELAGMLVRLLHVQEQADLHTYTDMQPEDPCYADMARAVAAGLFQGDGALLRPAQTLTREEAIVVLARCFGVPDGDPAALTSFSDYAQVSDWALGPVAGMVAEGYLKGAENCLHPQEPVTRQEAIQLICNASGTVVRDGEVPEQGNVTLLAGREIPEGLTIDGDLLLGCDFEEPLVLRGLRVTGRIVLHGGTLQLTGGSRAEEIVCAGGSLELETDGKTPVRVTAGRAELSGGGTVTAAAAVTLHSGQYPSLTVDGGTVLVEADASVGAAVLAGKGSRLTGTGMVSSALVTQRDCVVEAPVGSLQEAVDAGISGVQISAVLPANDATPSSPEIRTTVRFDHVETVNCSGAEDGVRYCTLSWYVDGVLEEKRLRVPLSDGATASFTTAADYSGRVRPERTVLLRLTYGDESVEFSQTVDQHMEQLPTGVQTLEVEATVLRNTSMYSYLDLSGWICNVPAGTKAVYINYYGTSSGKIRLEDGRTGWVRWSDLQISSQADVQAVDYSQVQKENFVNIIGYQSKTEYLVWISLLTQKVNVFEGEAEDWNLIRTFPCCTGKNSTPTISGVFQYQYRQNYWDFGYYYVNRPMIFNGGHAFHTRTYVKSTGAILDPTIGRPASNGCVRMYDEDVNWLWDHMPFGTTVVVF